MKPIRNRFHFLYNSLKEDTMLHRIYEHYKNPDENRINYGLMNREYEKGLEEYIIEGFESIHDVLDTITMTGHEFVVDATEINISAYDNIRPAIKREEKKQRKFKKQPIKDQKDYKRVSINESRVGELYMHFDVHDVYEGDNGKEPIDLQYTVKMLVPIPDNNGRMLLKGVEYTSQYQIAETSTYVTAGTVVMRSLMPIRVRQISTNVQDDDGNMYIVHSFQLFMISDFTNIFYFYFAKYGITNTLELFNVGQFIKVLPMYEITVHKKLPHCIYFPVGSDSVIEVVKVAFFQSDYIQSIVGTIADAIEPKITYEELFKDTVWISDIGNIRKSAKKDAFLELGKRYQILFNRMLDKSSRNSLRLQDHNKDTIYHIVRWMCQNYKSLRKKDNLDIMCKKLKCYQYIASLINENISEKIKRFVSTETPTKDRLINKYKVFFTYRGNEIISKIHKSGLVKYDDLVNDLTFFQKLKVTMKGPNALGNNNSRNISAKYRALHPSHIGILGIDTCSASDPGITNYINPLCETDGLFFKDTPPEPEDFFIRLMLDLGMIHPEESENGITIDPILFNNTLETVDNITVNKISNIEESEEIINDKT